MPGKVITTVKKTVTEVEAETFIKTNLRDLGFKEVLRPMSDAPQMKLDVSTIDGIQISNLQAQYSAWREYSEDLHAQAVVLETMLQEKFTYQYNIAKKTAQTEKPTERAMYADSDPNVYKLRQELTKATMYRELISAKIESFTNCLSTLSREISLRKQ